MRLRPWSAHSYYCYLVQNSFLESWVVSWKARWTLGQQVLCCDILTTVLTTTKSEWFFLGLEDSKVPFIGILTSCNTVPFRFLHVPPMMLWELGRPWGKGEAPGRVQARTATASPCLPNPFHDKMTCICSFSLCEPTTVTEQQQPLSFPTLGLYMSVLSQVLLFAEIAVVCLHFGTVSECSLYWPHLLGKSFT